MPYINVTIAGQPDETLSAEIAATVSGLTRDHLRKDPAITAISISYRDPAQWFVGGKSLDSIGLSSFWLDIKVVDGTNTKGEMASYIDAIFAAMAELLGGIHKESYILVHEVPASAYGYGGRTQEFRYIAGRMAPAA